MAVAMPMLMAAEEAHRLDQMQMLPSARHCDVQETALLLDLLTAADRHVRRDAAIDHVQHEHHVPLLAFGRVDRRQHELVLVEMGTASALVASGGSRVSSVRKLLRVG